MSEEFNAFLFFMRACVQKMDNSLIKLSEIWIYPIKSLPGIALNSAEIDACGFSLDRHWMLVDTNGNFLSQRLLPKMALINIELSKSGISLTVKNQPLLEISIEPVKKKTMVVKIWEDEVIAYHVTAEADEWFSNFLETPVTLVSMPEEQTRKVDQNYAESTDQTGFSDGFPFLLLGQASLDDLNRRIDNKSEPMNVRRFRPNLVVTGSDAYAEDTWKKIQIGEVVFRVVKPCSRCTITTVNPLTASRSVEPLQTLATYRREGNKVFFGQNLIHNLTGSLSVGDLVKVII